jgi:hypothetical protein
VRERTLAAACEATVVHVYNTEMTSKRVHLYIERSRGSLGHGVPSLLRK